MNFLMMKNKKLSDLDKIIKAIKREIIFHLIREQLNINSF